MTNYSSSGAANPLKSFRTKTILIVLALLAFWVALGLKFTIDFQTRQVMEVIDLDSRYLAQSILKEMGEPMQVGKCGSSGEFLSTATLHDNVRLICISNSQQKVVASSVRDLIGRPSSEVVRIDPDARFMGYMIEQPGNGSPPERLYSQTVRMDNQKSCAACHTDDGPVLGWLTVNISIEEIMANLDAMKNNIVMGGIVIGIMLSISISVFLTRRVNRPLERLADEMKRAENDLDVRFEAKHDDELKVLFEGFNNLMNNLKAAREELKGDYHTELGWYHKELVSTNEQLEESNRQLDEKLRKLATLMEIGQVIARFRKPDDLMRIALDAAVSQLNADRGSIMHYEKKMGELIVTKGSGLSPEHRRKNRFKLGEGIAGWVAAKREAAIVNDVSKDERFLPGVKGHRPVRLMAVPLISSKGEVLGVISLERGPEREVFGISDLEYLLAITGNASVAIENAELLQNLQKSYFDTISALAMTVEAKDPYTLGHSKRVTQYAMVVGEELGLPDDEIQVLQYGATLHDIGKIGVRESVLNKRGKLDEEEFREIMSHSEKGEAIIAGVDFLQPCRGIIRHHQEYYDGTGYPDGLKGDDIPMNVAIVSIADFYDALTTDRPYRPAFSHAQAIEMVKKETGRKLNPVVVEAFLKIFDEPEMV